MKLYSLIEKAESYPVFTLEDCRKWFPETTRGTLLLQLSQQVRSGRLLRLKRGLYMLPRKSLPDPLVIASRMDPRAVISLETVLHRAGITPEVSFATTAVTPGKTARFSTATQGMIILRHLKSEFFFGFTLNKFPPYTVRVATPEKALLDLLWFHRFEKDPEPYVRELRLTIPPQFSWKKFREYSRVYHNIYLARLSASVIKIYAHP